MRSFSKPKISDLIYKYNKMNKGSVVVLDLRLKGCWQCRSQKAEKVSHIKGRLLDYAVIFFNCVPFQNGNFS